MKNVIKRTTKFVKKNGATILTITGTIGVIATGVMAVRATPKAMKKLDEATLLKGEELTTFETIKVAGPVYIPVVAIGAATLASVIGSNMLNKKRQMNLIGAYTMLDQSFKEYKKKVEEIHGTDAAEEVEVSIAKDHYDSEKDGRFDDGADVELFYDMFSKRYFHSTRFEVLKAENAMNKEMANCGAVSVQFFYDLLKLETKEDYTELGWSQCTLSDMYWAQWLEFEHTKTVMEDGMECTIISFMYEPICDFEYY